MSAQETLTGPAHDGGGLWARYLADGKVNHAAWLRARASGEFVGTCRHCGDYLEPMPPEDRAGRTDYTARCRTPNPKPGEGCGYIMCAPGGRLGKHKRGG